MDDNELETEKEIDAPSTTLAATLPDLPDIPWEAFEYASNVARADLRN